MRLHAFLIVFLLMLSPAVFAEGPSGPPAGSPAGSPAGPGNPTLPPGTPAATISREEHERLIAEATKNAKKQSEQTLTQLRELESQLQQGSQAQTQLQQRIQELEEANMSVEERAKAQQKRLQAEFERKQKELETRATSAESRFADHLVRHEVIAAASNAGAINSRHVLNELQQCAEVREVKDEADQNTGEFEVIVKIPRRSDEGKRYVEEMTVADAVKAMAESDEHKFLFNSDRRGGTGSRPSSRGGGDLGNATPAQKISAGIARMASA